MYATEWASGCPLRWIMCHWGSWYSERGCTPSIMGSYKPVPHVTSLVNDCDAQRNDNGDNMRSTWEEENIMRMSCEQCGNIIRMSTKHVKFNGNLNKTKYGKLSLR